MGDFLFDAGSYPLAFGGSTGAQVVLNVYHLMPVSTCTALCGLGIHHSGVEVHGVEYGFGRCEDGTGVFGALPQSYHVGEFAHRVVLGWTPLGEEEVLALVEMLQGAMGPSSPAPSPPPTPASLMPSEYGAGATSDGSEAGDGGGGRDGGSGRRLLVPPYDARQWDGSAYHLLRHNCNHFSEAFAEMLLTFRSISSTHTNKAKTAPPPPMLIPTKSTSGSSGAPPNPAPPAPALPLRSSEGDDDANPSTGSSPSTASSSPSAVPSRPVHFVDSNAIRYNLASQLTTFVPKRMRSRHSRRWCCADAPGCCAQCCCGCCCCAQCGHCDYRYHPKHQLLPLPMRVNRLAVLGTMLLSRCCVEALDRYDRRVHFDGDAHSATAPPEPGHMS